MLSLNPIFADGSVYSWGDNRHQQLGHKRHTNDEQKPPVDISEPRRIDHLVDNGRHKIIDACAGDAFTVFLTESGALLSCGDNRSGCLGLGQVPSQSQPQQIGDELQSVRIVQVAAGPRHVVVCSANSQLFVWGRCDGGSLGLGADRLQRYDLAIHYEHSEHYTHEFEYFSLVPCLLESQHLQQKQSMKVDMKSDQQPEILKVVCSVKCTLVLLANGRLLASGRNYHDRLAFGADVVGSMILVIFLFDPSRNLIYIFSIHTETSSDSSR